jgi:hypothetical protein
MVNSRINARITGVLFILGIVPMITAMLLFGQVFSSSDILTAVAANRLPTLAFALAIIVMGLAACGMGISLYPALKRQSEGLARAAMGLRITEGALTIASAVGFFALVAVSQEFIKAGSPKNSFYQPAAAAIKAMNDWAANIYVMPFGAAALIYNAIFYRTRLVPRWLSVWGMVGILLVLISGIGGILVLMDPSSPVLFLLNMPILAQELVFAVWLIAKGYKE